MLRHLETALRSFPFSKLAESGIWIRVQPINWNEPTILEQVFPNDATVDDLLSAVRDVSLTDSAVQVEGHWDLWQFDGGDWSLKPSRIAFMAFGPDFEDEHEDHIRVDLGVDALYLPLGEADNEQPMVQANIRSVLQLASELDRVLNPASRRLWTESGENFAERLANIVLNNPSGSAT
jgi:hypothetical protein